MSVYLRQPGPGDAYALWLWANDPESRRASHGRGPIPWSEHIAWLTERLISPAARLFVAELVGGLPVGSIRFETADGWRTARLSYAIAPEARGRGLARDLVDSGLVVLRREHPEVRVIASVLLSNERSLRVFRALGWREERVDDDTAEFAR